MAEKTILSMYATMAVGFSLTFLFAVCGHCYGIDHSPSEYWANVLFQGAAWPITIPGFFLTGNPILLIKKKN